MLIHLILSIGWKGINLKIVNSKLENMSDYNKTTTCNVYSINVEVNNIEVRATEMIDMIADTSWISKLDIISRISYKARSKTTIDKLINGILKQVTTTVNSEFGEFLISVTAQDSLELEHNHIKVPLAELFKEKKTGNPGFDFHTESNTQLISFGEAKYSGVTNPYTNALTQISRFISLEKDKMELQDLQNFVSKESIENILDNKKAFVAAFSINSENPEVIIQNALKSEHIIPLLSFDELYIIGIKIND